MLYQTQHLRLFNTVSLAVDVIGLPSTLLDQQGNYIIRLGGEARTANLSICEKITEHPCFDQQKLLPKHSKKRTAKRKIAQILKKAKGIMIYLLTPLLIQKKQEKWQPLPDFELFNEKGKTTVWKGELEGKDQKIQLILHSAITGKMKQEGGWDAANHCPRKMQSFIPAGSVFYCESEQLSVLDTIEKLQGTQMGELQQYGYGQIAVGIWK
jgi:CRISPR-associated protein Cmr3